MVSKHDRIWAIYPEYFDSSIPRSRGRRVRRELAISSPSLAEVYLSATSQNFFAVKEENVSFPAYWWRRRGRLLVRKEISKSETIERIAEGLPEARKKIEKLKAVEEKAQRKDTASKKAKRSKDRRVLRKTEKKKGKKEKKSEKRRR